MLVQRLIEAFQLFKRTQITIYKRMSMEKEKMISAAFILAALIAFLAYASADAAVLNSSAEDGSLKDLSNSSNSTGAVTDAPLNESLNSTIFQDISQSGANSSIKQASQSPGPLNSEGETIKGLAALENASENKTIASKSAEIATYVYNDDNDKLEVSLYIDSVPRGKAEVDKGSEEKFDNYTLRTGTHRFKIMWKDPDTNKAYESEQKVEVSSDDVVRLYTTEHLEPQKFNLQVGVKNENDKETTAYLYIDGKFEKSLDLKEQSTSEFDQVSVEEGVHDVSLRWLDPYTNSEYEKKKRVTVDDDKAVVFLATKGISFEESGAIDVPEASQSSASNDEIHESKESTSEGSISEANYSTRTNNTDINSSSDGKSDLNSSLDVKSSAIDASSNSSVIENSAESKNEAAGASSLALKIGEMPGMGAADAAKGSGGIYQAVYLAVLLTAVYLVFRR